MNYLFKFYIAIFYLLNVCVITSAQNTFQKIINTSQISGITESFYSCTDHGFILTGFMNNGGNEQVLIIKLDSLANSQWTISYGGIYGDGGADVMQFQNGFIVAGHTNFANAGQRAILLSRINLSGNLIWTKTYGGHISDHARRIINDNGNIILAGENYNQGLQGSDFKLMKIDSIGNIAWSYAYGTINSDYLADALKTNDGGYILSGYTNGLTDSTQLALLIVKTDSSGILQWTRSYMNGENQMACRITSDANGGYMITGNYNVGSENKSYLLNIDSVGNPVWAKEYHNCYNYCIYKSIDGGNIVSGGYLDSISQALNAFIFKTDGSGNVLFTRNISDSIPSFLYKINKTNDSGYFALGFANQGNVISKLDSNLITGCTDTSLILQVTNIFFTDTTLATQVSVIDSVTSPVFPISNLSLTDSMLCETINFISEVERELLIFPNPFSDGIYIKFLNSSFKLPDLSITNILGDQIYQSSNYSSDYLVLDYLKSGIYFLEIKWADKCIVKKILKY